jgi:hypothetical protein
MKCSECKKELLKSHFYKESRTKRGYQYQCKKCQSKNRGKYYCPHRTSRRKKLNAYKLSDEDLDSLMSVGCCDICGKNICWNPKNTANKAYIDHCHETEDVRGVLCMQCNTSIGKLGDDIESIEHVLKYMKNPPGLCRE